MSWTVGLPPDISVIIFNFFFYIKIPRNNEAMESLLRFCSNFACKNKFGFFRRALKPTIAVSFSSKVNLFLRHFLLQCSAEQTFNLTETIAATSEQCSGLIIVLFLFYCTNFSLLLSRHQSEVLCVIFTVATVVKYTNVGLCVRVFCLWSWTSTYERATDFSAVSCWRFATRVNSKTLEKYCQQSASNQLHSAVELPSLGVINVRRLAVAMDAAVTCVCPAPRGASPRPCLLLVRCVFV